MRMICDPCYGARRRAETGRSREAQRDRATRRSDALVVVAAAPGGDRAESFSARAGAQASCPVPGRGRAAAPGDDRAESIFARAGAQSSCPVPGRGSSFVDSALRAQATKLQRRIACARSASHGSSSSALLADEVGRSSQFPPTASTAERGGGRDSACETRPCIGLPRRDAVTFQSGATNPDRGPGRSSRSPYRSRAPRGSAGVAGGGTKEIQDGIPRASHATCHPASHSSVSSADPPFSARYVTVTAPEPRMSQRSPRAPARRLRRSSRDPARRSPCRLRAARVSGSSRRS